MNHRRGRPAVTIHYAQTLDGRIATRTGHARWISCGETLRLAHQLRAEHDAILVGVGTVLADDPQLTVRLTPGRSPRRIVLDSTLRIPLDAQVLTDGAAPTLIVTGETASPARVAAVRDRGCEVVTVTRDGHGVSLPALLDLLGGRGIRSLLVEGGSRVITSFLRGGLVDRLVVCVAPKIVGAGIEAVGDLDILRMGDALPVHKLHINQVGTDLILDGTIGSAAGAAHG